MPLTVAIKGLCLAAQRQSEFEVLLNHAMGHAGTLTILTEFLDPDPDDTERWDPDRLGYVPVYSEETKELELKQVGIWDLKNTEVRIGSENGPLDVWTNRLKETIAFDLPSLHNKQCITGPVLSSNFTVVRIREGHPGAGPIVQSLTLKDGNDPAKVVSLEVAYELRFSNINTKEIVNSAGRRIPFHRSLSDFFVVVANQAIEPDQNVANAHFGHYYEVITKPNTDPIDRADRFRIGNSADEVYDCVPPTTGP